MNFTLKYQASEKHKLRRYTMAKFISLLIGFQGLLMGLLTLREGSNVMSFTAFSYSLVMISVYIYTKIKKNVLPFSICTLIIVYYLELNFIFHGGTEGFGIIWLIAVPIFSLYYFENHGFICTNSLLLLILCIFYWTPLKQYIYDFKPSFMVRFPLVYMLIFFFCIFLKYSINKTENELETQKDILSKEISQAAQLQKSFLQQKAKTYLHWTVACKNIPVAGVSGDLYDVYSHENIIDGAGIFDISGHGVSSGMITMLIRNIIQDLFYADYDNELWETVQKINDTFIKEKGDVQNYLTGIFLRINDNNIELVNAGHQFPVLYKKATNTFEIIQKDPLAIGAIGLNAIDPIYISQYITMESGDELFLFTDGLPDCENEEKLKFGINSLIGLFKKNIMCDVNEQLKLILQDISDFRGKATPADDMTLFILKKD